ncbi:sugar ABC transporter substrate-binding protein [Thiospirochaeta perfilievii]|uniref:Sugar ABC transporter substrate-binding protein n=1 Tax=Thiospirochaeta perfilievii TaxID=252967 RepID=A0A5C1Q7I8_9SPIO|nr:substrate-binding domain-containing protein [Thiospirochaeta perfilievii]QEN03278.1 sugar ABC transporter substrate-binding protein [Thiospirochaeta perfilievii]
MSKKYLYYIFLISIVINSCSEKEEKLKDRVKIGFSTSSEIFLQERWKRDISIFTSSANELDADVIFSKSTDNRNDQISEILYLLKQDIDVLVVIPRDKNNLVDVIKKANDKGIPVLSYDRLINGVPLAGYVSFDNQEVGKYMAKALLSSAPTGNYIIVNGSIYDNNSFEVNLGIHKILDPQVESGKIKIVEEIWLNEWSYDEAFMLLNNIFENRVDIDAISGANDMMAQAAIKVLSERRLAGEITVVGQDADLAACQSIISGTQMMTVYKPIQKLAKRAAQVAVSLGKNQEVEPDMYINNQSEKSIPYYIENPIPVTKENMMEVIVQDSFHSENDIYVGL